MDLGTYGSGRVDGSTGTTGTHFSHFPEVVLEFEDMKSTHLLVALQNVVLGEVRLPDLVGLVVALDAIGLRTLEIGGVP